jgi:hypothetical protein
MIWDKKYRPWVPEIICPVCEKRLTLDEWEDYGMHLQCTEYYLSGRYFEEKKKVKKVEPVNVSI